jgi:hypothetical protein
VIEIKKWQLAAAIFIVVIAQAAFSIYSVKENRKGSDQRLSEKLYQNQLQACREREKVKAESNRRISQHLLQDRAIVLILNTASTAWLQTYNRTKSPAALIAHDKYVEGKGIADQINFKRVKPVDCNVTVKHP